MVFSTSSLLTFASLAASVQAHGYISQPKATYEANTIYTTYNAVTSASINSGFDGGTYNWSPEQNVQSFTEHWNATGYASLREMLDPVAPGYGYSLDTADPVDVSGMSEMWWQNDEYKEGFIASHHVRFIPPSELCLGLLRCYADMVAAMLYAYLQYVDIKQTLFTVLIRSTLLLILIVNALCGCIEQCVPIVNGEASTTSTAGEASAATEAPAVTTATPEVTTAAPEATTAAPEATEATPEATEATPEVTAAAPEVTTAAPEVTTAAPEATEVAKCTRRKL
ncbi:hypothetical protein BBJ28_00014366 [Nothophytophthora sp. Chile5]|nr:hypothetical protein BBJ28_00014366 [Nothophytophthora sp. Chile5]